MYEKTSAIVLHLTRHTDRLSIAHLYTERFGRVDCLVSGSGSRRSGVQRAVLEPLAVVNVELARRGEQQPFRLCSAGMAAVRTQTIGDMSRRCVALFVAEVLFRSLRLPQADPELFAFVADTADRLEREPQVANLHLVFLYRLSVLLGFEPNLAGGGSYWDLESGEMVDRAPLHTHYIKGAAVEWMRRLSAADYDTMETLCLTQASRRELLTRMEEYFRLHVPNYYGTQSLAVMQELFD